MLSTSLVAISPSAFFCPASGSYAATISVLHIQVIYILPLHIFLLFFPRSLLRFHHGRPRGQPSERTSTAGSR